ncbi:LuxR C-terminal-related transcriptional regulator [Aeromonas veronii]|uniref:LuxR C-terminal-related transcriptional regulator n=1 Tax=Aeromonas veronii TaxID=654 RepID=UPI0040557691
MHTIEFYHDNPIIEHAPGILLVKDLQHRFIASNANFEEYSGFSSRQLVGLSDFDMPWFKHADIYISHEKDILAGRSYIVIEPLSGLKKTSLITEREIIYNKDGVPSGIISTSIPFSPPIEMLPIIVSTIKPVDVGVKLTKKETVILYFILKGYKRSDITKYTQVSVVAYDRHINNIKQKLDAKNTVELINKASELGINQLAPFTAEFKRNQL